MYSTLNILFVFDRIELQMISSFYFGEQMINVAFNAFQMMAILVHDILSIIYNVFQFVTSVKRKEDLLTIGYGCFQYYLVLIHTLWIAWDEKTNSYYYWYGLGGVTNNDLVTDWNPINELHQLIFITMFCWYLHLYIVLEYVLFQLFDGFFNPSTKKRYQMWICITFCFGHLFFCIFLYQLEWIIQWSMLYVLDLSISILILLLLVCRKKTD
jgi:hypothetical protein